MVLFASGWIEVTVTDELTINYIKMDPSCWIIDATIAQVTMRDRTIDWIPATWVAVRPPQTINETVMIAKELTLKDVTNHEEIWVGDTGASRHMSCSPHGFYDAKQGTASDAMAIGYGKDGH